MILGIGIDTIEIIRFSSWHTYNHAQLQRIFSAQEIEYCLSIPSKSAERFAVRFAAREAFLKALNAAAPHTRISLLWICRHVDVDRTALGTPILTANWQAIRTTLPEIPQNIRAHLSLTHTVQTASAFVILEAIERKDGQNAENRDSI